MPQKSVVESGIQTSLLQSIRISQKRGLGRKLLIAVLLTSSIFTFFQVSWQLYDDYLAGLGEIDQKFEQIHISYQQSLVRSIWDVAIEETTLIATGILSLPNVEQVRIAEYANADFVELIDLSTEISKDLTAKTYVLTMTEDDITTVIGELNLKISLAPLYSDLYDKLLFILVFQTIKTFSVSILIFSIFHYLVTQHLITMSKFSQLISEDNLDQKLVLQRKHSSTDDELDTMVKALNNTKLSMKNMLESNIASQHLRYELAQKQKQEEQNNKHRRQIESKNIELHEMIGTLNDTQEQLVNSEKMALLGNMVKGVSHELNTPIGVSITGISHLQKESVRIERLFAASKMTKSDLVEFFAEINDLSTSINISLQKAAELIQSFKLVSVEQHQDEACLFNLHDNFSDITKSLQHALKAKNIHINNQIPADININSFPGVFYQIYTNLINNVTLHAFADQQPGEINVNAVTTSQLLTLTFSDNGKGMPKAILDKLFMPFFTTKRGAGGSGLGMSIVNTLVTEKLQGKIAVHSEEDVGTSFEITINTAS